MTQSASTPNLPAATQPHTRFSFDRIVVGVEGEVTDAALLSAAKAAMQDGNAKLTAVHSLLIPPANMDTGLYPPVEAADAMLRMAKANITQQMEHMSPPIQADVETEFGPPGEVVLSAAREQVANLLIVGSHGRHGLQKLILGSVSESLLTHAPCPVLVIGPDCEHPERRWKHILFASDLEDTGYTASEYACSLAQSRNAELTLLHVEQRKPHAEDQWRKWLEDNVKERLERLFDRKKLNACQHEAVVAYGDAAQEILAIADARAIDLIILGTGRHVSLSSHSPWRTAGALFQHARCPILNVGPGAS